MTKFSVIVPTYNERRNIGILYLLLREAFAHPSLAKDEFEVVVVDDNSPDGTADVVRALQKEYRDERLLLRPRAGKLGLGTAYIHGLAHATGDFVVIMDADLSHHPRAIPEFIAKQRATGCDVVTGTRYVRRWRPRMGHATKTHIPRRQLPRARPAQPGSERPDRVLPPLSQGRVGADGAKREEQGIRVPDGDHRAV